MWLMGAPGIFFVEGYHLIVKSGILWGSLDDHDIVHLLCIRLPRGLRGSSRCRTPSDGSDFSNGPRPIVFSLFLLCLRFCWTTVGGAADILL